MYSISLDRDSAGVKGPVLRVLASPENAAAKGTVKFAANELAELARGNLALVVYTRDHPRGTLRARLTSSTSR